MKEKKPALGIMPFKEFERQRIIGLAEAIIRYAKEGIHEKDCVVLWAAELNARVSTANKYEGLAPGGIIVK